MKKVIIIGGGAAGIFSAINLKKTLGNLVDVTILEKQNRIGKKILMTGNGKCNISNLNILDKHYNTDLVDYCIKSFTPNNLIDYFYDLGLMLKSDDAGRLYPYSEKASNVLDLLISKLNELGVEIICDFDVNHVKSGNEFLVYSVDRRLLRSDYLIIATGGKASINFENNSYDLLSYFGHTITLLKPGLVALITKENVKSLSGLRVKGKVSITKNGRIVFETTGEILFKDNGLSGIAIFEASRFYNEGCKVFIDLAYDKTKEELENFIKKANSIEEGLNGILPKMISLDIMKRGKNIVDTIKNYEFNIIGTYDFNFAQITVGGVSLQEINPFTYESFKVRDLYAVGEVLDVDGTSGGYNLHFAWSSGYLASNDIINKIKEKEE